MPVTVQDEVYDAQGNLISSTPREIVESPFTRADYLLARRQVRAVLLAPATPVWGKVLAKFLLMQEYLEREDDESEPPYQPPAVSIGLDRNQGK